MTSRRFHGEPDPKRRPERWSPRPRRGVSYCGLPDCAGPRKCRSCRNAYMRAYRAAGMEKRDAETRRRSNARSYAQVYLSRGRLKRSPCVICGDPQAEMHHPDYSKPLDIRWLCRRHHRELHRE